jgi:hypothetical protein
MLANGRKHATYRILHRISGLHSGPYLARVFAGV